MAKLQIPLKVVIASSDALRFIYVVNLNATGRPVLRRLAITTLILVAASLLLLLFEHLRGGVALQHRMNELVRQGEQFDITKLEPIHPKPSDDAAAALLSLTNRLNPASTNLFELLPPWGHFAAPGKAVVTSTLTQWPNRVYRNTTNSWTSLHHRLAQDPTLPDAIHAGLLKPGWDDGFNYHKGFVDVPFLQFITWKQTASYLEACALAALQKGDRASAVDRTEDMLRLVRHQANSSVIISELVRIACAQISWQPCWELVTSGQTDEAQLARLQTAWEALDFSTSMSRAMEMERAVHMDLFERAITSTDALEETVKLENSMRHLGFSSGEPLDGALLRGNLLVWKFAWARQDQLRALNRWQAVIEFDRHAHVKSWASLKDQAAILDRNANELSNPGTRLSEPSRPSWYDRTRFLFSEMAYGTGSGTTRVGLELETQRRLMITAIALRRHQLRQGTYPERLQELKPGLLAEVPIDPMDGRPLRYRRLADGSPLLYSVGLDGHDDGGDASVAKGDQEGAAELWQGKDVVWPMPASPEAAEKAVNERSGPP